MTAPKDMSVFALTASAYEIAEFLDVLGSREKSAVIRELINRVIPTKVIPSRGLKAVAVPAPTPATSEMVWCDQCDRRVAGSMATTCKSRFCSLRKSA
ncbi:hypothetical protein F1640_15055 [Novosphingobium sp. NBM11]|uniref:hypothetical protein n=1 Tax=Novosphingobium sp. NBM11 TaxID=2596914 RepID=UPI001892021A|nr:hypothetical protein [Novosphingobium sp. NBM11]MBF5091305.1 hypothetical protein [Novosphingobium sp. NBM11]